MKSPGAGFFDKRFTHQYTKIMKFFDYLRDSKAEMAHVKWPTRRTTIAYTILVIVVCIVASVALGVSDYIFSRGLPLFIN